MHTSKQLTGTKPKNTTFFRTERHPLIGGMETGEGEEEEEGEREGRERERALTNFSSL